MVSGYDSSVVETSDPAVLLEALGRPVTADEIAASRRGASARRCRRIMAAARENRAIDFDELVAFSRAAVAAADGMLFIEGVGGIMVPLDERADGARLDGGARVFRCCWWSAAISAPSAIH